MRVKVNMWKCLNFIFLSTVYDFSSLNTKNTIRTGVRRTDDHISFDELRMKKRRENKGEKS